MTIPAAIWLSLEAKAGAPTAGTITYGVSLFLLLAVSGTYHTPYWSKQTRARFQRLDRSMIFVLIAGSYTPFLLAGGETSVSIFLPFIWVVAVLGILRTVFLPNSSRRLTVVSYVAMGWLSLPLLPGWVDLFGMEVIGLIAAGGLIFTLGAITYAKRWPNPWPRTLGYHEIFHVAVLLGSVCHGFAVWMVVA